MPAKSKAQRRMMAMCEHGKKTKNPCPKMSKKKMHDYAATKEKGMPEKKGKETNKMAMMYGKEM